MINRIKCLVKGHRFLMNYQPHYGMYCPTITDRCHCCSKKRGNTKLLFTLHHSLNLNN